MSSYEDYDRVSRSNGRTRRPVGLTLVRKELERYGTVLSTLKLIDAGCYTTALGGIFPETIALDISAGMLAAAQAKCRGLKTRFVRASIRDIPFGDGTADGVLNNLVLHHLPNDGVFAVQRETFSEFARILRLSGAFVIGVTTREQLRDGYWFTRLIPQIIEICCQVTAPLDQKITMLEASGFTVETPAIPWNDVLQGDAYIDRLGPLDPAWRDGVSVWSLSPPTELEAACARVRGMETAGTLAEWARHITNYGARPDRSPILALSSAERNAE